MWGRPRAQWSDRVSALLQSQRGVYAVTLFSRVRWCRLESRLVECPHPRLLLFEPRRVFHPLPSPRVGRGALGRPTGLVYTCLASAALV